MASVRESEEVTRAAAELNAHVTGLDQDSDTAHIINEIFYHMNQINEEVEKVILLNNLLRQQNSSRVNELEANCKCLLIKFYQALLQKVHQEILDSLIKNDHNGVLPIEPNLSNERIKVESEIKNNIINHVADYKIPLSLERKIVILEALKMKQEDFLCEAKKHHQSIESAEVIAASIQRLALLLEDCFFLYEVQNKRGAKSALHNLSSKSDETTRTNVLASEKENGFFQHVQALNSTIGNSHPRTQRLHAIQENMAETKNPVMRALVLGDIIEQEIQSGKSLLKPDLVIMKQYRDALLRLACIQLTDDLIGDEKIAKLKEPWLSIERDQVLERILKNSENMDLDPCKQIKFSNALTPLQHEQMKLVLLQGIKHIYQTATNHNDLPHDGLDLNKASDVTKLIEYLETWEAKYKIRIQNDNLDKESVTENADQVAVQPKKTAKTRWKIFNVFHRKK